MNLTEKGARALYAQAIGHALGDDEDVPAHWLAHARAVIEAIREPTEAMVEAALTKTATFRDIPGSALTVNREKMRIRWRAAIDAALKEGK